MSFEAEVCLNVGLLEQVVCTPGTREHEAVLVTEARPSEIHAGLLMLGLEPGRPGSWRVRGGTLELVPPTGPRVRVLVRRDGADDAAVEPVARWIRGFGGGAPLPDESWIFAGSAMAPTPTFLRPPGDDHEPGEHYVADLSGSVVGLVTFGDELLAWPEVLPDRSDVMPLEWEAATERMPPEGTRVTVVLEPDPRVAPSSLPDRTPVTAPSG